MITGGNATIFVANMDASLKFYSEVLGLKVSSHYGDHWATVEAGSFTIGLHPTSEKHPAPGTPGSIMIGLGIDESIDAAAARLKSLGVKDVGEVQRDQGGSFVHFSDLDGNELYLWESAKWS
ncbi:VOC family protein [Tunturibacter empetritectus]|uniref:Catechol 2,3-dioxygenase n=1 Tax=Tunturiibacter lichenicola TaxID=2051959 RepID=A0A7W8N566_9BACT|nr:VOC family protein [Edaphobacter lichenicola]MBB5344266.1 catechol 2,3-dioxygenase [Edaphobacter lichenicola]